ncbi:MAG: hypothetical protein HOQ22_04255 [Nocardioidaceae bacterium]|nr:hypothetical protein [Nocardioidaceae bacterium]
MKNRQRALRRTRFTAGALAAAAVLATAAFTAAPAQSETTDACPLPYPVDQVTPDLAVTGTTTTTGNQPEQLTGTTLGVLKDGIAPGLDMILVDLHSPTIDTKTHGIWSGMSGSPVYLDGKLLGAVAYSLGFAPSTIAGVTPAGEMQRMLSTGARPATPTPATVDIPQRIARRLVANGATTTQVDQGMRQLQLPFAVSGLSSSRLDQLAPLYQLGKMRVTGSTGGSGTATAQTTIEPGQNLAASMSYGTIAAAGFGTATMTCGNEVVGFGHPMNLTGPSTMTMHTADTVVVQDDSVLSGFTVANLGPAVGTIDQDRTAGIHGQLGAAPTGTPVDSVATSGGPIGVDGGETREGHSVVTVPDVFSQVAFTNMIAIQDRAMSQLSGGSGWAGWTIKGSHDGKPFSLTRKDLYADKSDISSAMSLTMAEQLSTLEENGAEDVTFDSVSTDSRILRPYQKWTVTGVDIRRNFTFRALHEGFPTGLHAGRPVVLRVHLTSKQLGKKNVMVRTTVPKGALNRGGTLQVFGGDDGAPIDDEFFIDGFDILDFFFEDEGPSVDELLASYRSAPHHNDVVATLTFPNARGFASVPRTKRTPVPQVVVGGSFTVPVRGVR